MKKLLVLEQYLQGEYYVVLMDFQTFGEGQFRDENVLACSFARTFIRLLEQNKGMFLGKMAAVIANRIFEARCSSWVILRIITKRQDI